MSQVRIKHLLFVELSELARKNKRSLAGETQVAIEFYLESNRKALKSGAKLPEVGR